MTTLLLQHDKMDTSIQNLEFTQSKDWYILLCHYFESVRILSQCNREIPLLYEQKHFSSLRIFTSDMLVLICSNRLKTLSADHSISFLI